MKCIWCENPAVAVDLDYDEGYCQPHFAQQMRSSEPIEHFRHFTGENNND